VDRGDDLVAEMVVFLCISLGRKDALDPLRVAEEGKQQRVDSESGDQ